MTKSKVIDVISMISAEIIKMTNDDITSDAFVSLYESTLSELMADSDQQTQDTTKFLQYFVNKNIVNIMKARNIDGYKDEVTGHDYMMCGLPIEFKLMGGNDLSSFATGNKTSAFGGAKTNLVWTIKYTISDGKIDSYSSVLVDTDLVSTPWNSGNGRKDSYSTLKILRDEIESVNCVYGLIREGRKYLQLLPIPVGM